jgi:hypothetical protein
VSSAPPITIAISRSCFIRQPLAGTKRRGNRPVRLRYRSVRRSGPRCRGQRWPRTAGGLLGLWRHGCASTDFLNMSKRPAVNCSASELAGCGCLSCRPPLALAIAQDPAIHDVGVLHVAEEVRAGPLASHFTAGPGDRLGWMVWAIRKLAQFQQMSLADSGCLCESTFNPFCILSTSKPRSQRGFNFLV